MHKKLSNRTIKKAIRVLNDSYESPDALNMFGERVVSQEALWNSKVCKLEDIAFLVDWLDREGYVVSSYDDENGRWLTQTPKCKFYREDQDRAKDKFSRRVSLVALLISLGSLIWQVVSHFIGNS